MLVIDLTALVPSSLRAASEISPTMLRNIMLDVVDAARAKWVRLSMDELHSSQQEYTKGISAVRVDGDVASITLDGSWPNMIERGFGPFDMRDTLLGPNVPVVGPDGGKGKRESADGHFYRYIFFRIMGPGATGRNARRATDLYASEFGAERARKLGALGWKAMKKLEATRSNPGAKTKWGARLETAGTALDLLGTSHALEKNAFRGFGAAFSDIDIIPAKEGSLFRHGGAKHKAPLFEGAYRFEQKYKSATQSFYGTFRTISTAEPDGWIHPGHQPGVNLADKVNEYSVKLAGDLFSNLAAGG